MSTGDAFPSNLIYQRDIFEILRDQMDRINEKNILYNRCGTLLSRYLFIKES